MRVREGWHILWRAPDAVQVGVDPPGSLAIEGLTPRERDYLLRLSDGRAKGPVPPRTRGTMALLHHLGVVDEGLGTFPHVGAGAGEAASLTRLGADAGSTLRRRNETSIMLDGEGALAAEIAAGLAASGVGRIRLASARPGQLQCGARTPVTSGVAKDAARLRREYPMVQFRLERDPAPESGDAELVIMVRPWQPDLVLGGALLAADVPHLVVIVGELHAQIGPLVVPGRTACLRCIALEKTAADPAWPTLATQLGATTPPQPPQGLLLRAAGIASQAALAYLDKGLDLLALCTPAALGEDPTPSHGTGQLPATAVTVSCTDLSQRTRQWWPSPECGCTGLQ